MREEIEYKNITLLPIKYEDTDNIVRWRNSKEVREKFLWQEDLTKKQHEYWLKTQIDTGNTVQFIIKENVSGKKIGTTFLKNIDNINRKAEFGIFIGEISEQGKGFGTNAIKAIISFGFESLLLNKIYLRVLESNIVAFKLYEHIGFRLDGKLRDEVSIGGIFHNIYIMSILRAEKELVSIELLWDNIR